VTPNSNYFLGIRTRKESCGSSKKGSKEKIILGEADERQEE
jgi:hypothetical protein